MKSVSPSRIRIQINDEYNPWEAFGYLMKEVPLSALEDRFAVEEYYQCFLRCGLSEWMEFEIYYLFRKYSRVVDFNAAKARLRG